MRSDYQTVVVGGGPAGATAARTVKEHAPHMEVVLFDEGTRRDDRDRVGPDSTDAAGQLRYWMEGMPQWVVDCLYANQKQQIDKAIIYGGRQRYEMQSSRPFELVKLTEFAGDPAETHSGLAITFDRPAFDDALIDACRDVGVDVKIGERVTGIETTWDGSRPLHHVTVTGGKSTTARFLVLADGPKRRVTIDAIQQFADRETVDAIRPANGNQHTARQLYINPEKDVDWDASAFQFHWGVIPGQASYPWVFPLGDGVYEVGVTRPTELDAPDAFDQFDIEPREWALLNAGDESYPGDKVILQRWYERVLGGSNSLDEMLVEGHGKNAGRESYVISSMRAFESPAKANIAVAGGAGGFTSAFHEGGDHVAVYTGALAGKLIGERESLTEYNRLWKRRFGNEVCANMAMAALADGCTPQEYERVFNALFGGRPETVPEAVTALRYGYEMALLRLKHGHDLVARLQSWLPDETVARVWRGAVDQPPLPVEESEYTYPQS